MSLVGPRSIGAVLSLLTFATQGQPVVTDIRQGTNVTVAVSPDGQTLVTDLLDGIWQMPVAGGGALPLVPPGEGARHPQYSPDGDTIVYQRYIDGQWDLWLLDVATGASRALTTTDHDERHPDFAPDGRRIVFAANPTGRYALWSIGLDGGSRSRLNDEPGDSLFPAISESGEIAYVNRTADGSTLRLLDGEQASSELLARDTLLSAPSWRPGGGVIVYYAREALKSSRLEMLVLADKPIVRALTSGEDVFESSPAWLSPREYLYTADGQIWRRGIAGFEREPVHLIAAVTLDVALPIPMDALVDTEGPFVAQGIVGASRRGDVTAFSALGDLWLSTRRGTRRLTDDAFVDVEPSLSPDGTQVLFASDRSGQFDLWQIDTDTATLHAITSNPARTFAPALSPDARYVAYLETAGFGPPAETILKLRDLTRDDPPSRLGEPLYDPERPRWATVGREPRILVEARPGTPTAAHRTLSFDIGGNLMPSDERREEPDPAANSLPDDARPQWSRPAAENSYVIQAGRVFDGVRNGYQRHVDIHVEGRQIVAIVGRGLKPSATARIVDAREATVIPGLIDTHAHQSGIGGERLGRAWLAYGVTTVRETVSDLNEALARAEAWASGAQRGPRLVVGTRDTAHARPLPTLPIRPSLASLAHELYRQEALLDFPRLPRTDFLAASFELEPAHDIERLRVSPLLRSYQDTLGVTLRSRRFLSTTLAAATGQAPTGALRRDPAYARLFTVDERAAWQAIEAADGSLAAIQDTLARLVRSGANVALGSDAPAVPHGLGLHMELELLAEAGIPNDQILRLATAQGARALGLDARLGTLEAGKIADLVIVDGDPLARIDATRNVLAVVLEGRWHDRDALLEPMPRLTARQ